MGVHLPDPRWADGPGTCVECGYSLAGLAAPGLCPECGAAFAGRCLILAGVPRASSSMTPWRRAAWWVVGVLGLLYSQFWVVLLMSMGLYTALSVGAVIVMALGFLVATAPRRKRSAERFIISAGGITRASLEGVSDGPVAIAVPLGEANRAELKRISSVWRRMRLGTEAGHGRVRDVVFEAGIRCPDGAAGAVIEAVEGFLRERRCAEAAGSTAP